MPFPFLVFSAILASFAGNILDIEHPEIALTQMSNQCSTTMNGLSGALYSVLFAGCAVAFRNYKEDQRKTRRLQLEDKEFVQIWIDGFGLGIDAIKKYGGAQAGDCTVVTERASTALI